MGFWLQLKLLLWKNLTLKKRKPMVVVFEVIIPLVLFLVLAAIRKNQPARSLGASKFPAYPLPSAGVIAVMQAFCDNGVHDEHGFANFPNSTVNTFLEKLSIVSKNYSFFQSGFSPNELGDLPQLYGSLVQDPVSARNYFNTASKTSFGSFLDNRTNFETYMIKKLNISEDAADVFLSSAIDMSKLYGLMFGIPSGHLTKPTKEERVLLAGTPVLKHPNVYFGTETLNQLSLDNLESLLGYLRKNKEISKSNKMLWTMVSNIFNFENTTEYQHEEIADALKDVMFTTSGLTHMMCEKHSLPDILMTTQTEDHAKIKKVKEAICHMNKTEFEKLTFNLKEHVDSKKLSDKLYLNEWNITLVKQKLKKLVENLGVFSIFENTLHEISDLATALPQDACNALNDNNNYANDTAKAQDKKSKKPKPQYGLLRVWFGMQKTICGKESNISVTLPTDGDDELDLDQLGMSKYQQEQLGILVHVLYSNPKVLYAPNNTAADEIMKKANQTFELLDTVTQYAHRMLNISEQIRSYLSQSDTDNNLDALQHIKQNLKSHPLLLSLFNSEGLDHFADKSAIANKDVFLQKLDIIDNAACSWISLTSGVSLNIFQGFKNQEDLYKYHKHQAYFDNVTVLANVIFNMEKDGSLPNHMVYTIRQNASFTSITNLVRNRFWFPGPRNWGYGYYQFGFVWIQDILERAMISLYAGKDVSEPGSYIHQFPYPCYLQDQFLFIIEHVMPLCLTVSWVYSVAMLVQSIVYEKEKRLKEVMKTMGLNNGVHWLAWFITSFTQMSVTAALLTVILKYGKILNYSNPLLIFLILEIFVVANIAFSFLVSAVYSKAKLAAACAGIVFFMSYVPYMYIAVREEAAHHHIPSWLKSLASLLSTTAFGLGAKYFAFYEEVGVGAQWSNIGVSPVEDDNYNLWSVIIMMFTDIFLYFGLMWYIENVHPGSYGLPKPWYFPFTKSYWLGVPKSDTECNNLTNCFNKVMKRHHWRLSVVEQDQACAMSNKACDDQLFEPEPGHLPLGVCVENLVKVYKTGNKLAVNNLSLNLYEGQITSFLGHNGAGKTTTMSILTGLIPATSGYATIYGHDIRTDMDIIRRSMGMCPQHNVLFDNLTVEEHLWLYSRLKNMPEEQIKEQMSKMIEDLNLPLKRHTRVHSLSGGMKRKLSVAIAFVGGSQVVILDEPTSGIDPFSRRAIWDLILKYKKGRTILLSTHHMDEADILGDRIAIISNGQLRCCGTSLFLKNNLGEGYHLYLVKKPPSFENEKVCREYEVTNFINQHVSTAYLVSESKHELHYILPVSELRKGSFEKLFTALERNLSDMAILSYGVKNTTLEEVFLEVAEGGRNHDEVYVQPQSQAPRNRVEKSPKHDKVDDINGLSYLLDLNPEDSVQMTEVGQGDSVQVQIKGTVSDKIKKQANDGRADYYQLPNGVDDVKNILSNVSTNSLGIDGASGSYKVHGKALYLKQFSAIIIKRFICTKRNWKGLFSQILLPAFFVSIAMYVALTAPKVEDLNPLVLSPSQYYNYTQPEGNVIPYAYVSEDLQTPRWSDDASAHDILSTLHLPSGVGATCVLQSPFNNSFDDKYEKLNFSVRNFELLSQYFEPSCESVFVPGLPLDNFVPPPPTTNPLTKKDDLTNGSWFHTIEPPSDKVRYYPYCHCSDDKTGHVCQTYGFSYPPSYKVVTGDILFDVSGQNLHEYFLYTTSMYRLRRYGALSFGLVRDYVPPEFGKNSPDLFKKIAVRNVAQAWFNNKGFHSMPTYVNALNNAILRANLPKSKGNPAAYGITVINHPMTDTTYMVSMDQILQGTDVLISIFIIVAMSFVPASFVLYLVYERYTKAKHLHFVSGVVPVVYWIGNYVWDLFSYILPASTCIIVLKIFDLPAYTSDTNFPAVVSLFLLYGWSIAPVMYPVSFLFTEPSAAYVFLIVINLFIGITCLVTSFIMEIFSYDPYLQNVRDILKTVFLIFPNYCLGSGLMDVAFNEYKNFFFTKTGQYDKMRSPFEWKLVTRNLVSMALSGIIFFIITLLCEYNFFRKPNTVEVSNTDNPEEEDDEDVARERHRVLSGEANSDVLQLVNLTKVYDTGKSGNIVAVDRLCLGVTEGECLGLLGVNGAGKTTVFKALTGDIPITSGDAYLNSYSIRREFNKIQEFIGYCPQFDSLYEELTGREHLMLYTKFRGTPFKDEKKVIDWALKKLDLLQYADRQAGTYSGGNKRKLSTAIALLGSPPVIFLDEPTTGMDPYTRRFLWDLIVELVKNGRSVVLTSHSMEECEILCTRLAILVSGHFRCLGSIQHLKNRFGEGYYITLRTKEIEQEPVMRWMRRTFPDSTLKEKHFNMLYYELKCQNISLSYVFSKLESALHDLPIEDYSVCQNTLDNVFINFAKQQSENSLESTSNTTTSQPISQLEESLEDNTDDDVSQINRSQASTSFNLGIQTC